VFEAGSELDDDFVSYQPVSYGSSTWQNDPLTLVQEGPGNSLRIIAPIIASFFLEGHTSFNVRGNAMLAFAPPDSSKDQMALLSEFNLKVELNNTMVESTDNELAGIEVEICQCEEDYSCLSLDDILPIRQDESLSFCIFPTPLNETNAMKISNVFTIFEAGSGFEENYVSYQPVSYGSTTWQSDSLTLVQEGPTNRLRITTTIPATFFWEGHLSIRVKGSALLENFPSSDPSKVQLPSFSSFDLKVDLNNDFGGGRIHKCFSVIKESLFRIIRLIDWVEIFSFLK